MNDNAIHITNLSCGYKQQQILNVKELGVPKHKLTFIVGKSGVGKSTLLELLGLMNNPILNPTKYHLSYHFPKETLVHSNLHLKSKVADIRSKYFSFLFQENNLLQHYTALENILLGSVSSNSFKVEASKIESFCSLLNLNENLLKRSVQDLSGGERKRVAFIRSLMKEHELIFGDEPTGNLDLFSSRLLMDVLKLNIKQNAKSALIVSHDIDLALEYGDRIVVMTMKNGVGVIDAQHIFDVEDRNTDFLRNRIVKLLAA